MWVLVSAAVWLTTAQWELCLQAKAEEATTTTTCSELSLGSFAFCLRDRGYDSMSGAVNQSFPNFKGFF